MPELINATTGVVLAREAVLATSPIARLVGLIGRTGLPESFALGITHCDCVHTLGVRLPLDLVFCDTDGVVLATQSLSPNRVSARVRGAVLVWEAAAGQLLPSVNVGETLCVR